MQRDVASEDGQISLLIIGFVLVALLLITVVVDVSKVFLAQRSLSGAADAAATSAANAIDVAAVYSGYSGEHLPLSSEAVRNSVVQYASVAHLDEQFRGFEVVQAQTDGVTATVTLRALVPLPFINSVSDRYSDGVPIEVTASARSPLQP